MSNDEKTKAELYFLEQQVCFQFRDCYKFSSSSSFLPNVSSFDTKVRLYRQCFLCNFPCNDFARYTVSQFSKTLRNVIFAFDCTSCARPGVDWSLFSSNKINGIY